MNCWEQTGFLENRKILNISCKLIKFWIIIFHVGWGSLLYLVLQKKKAENIERAS